MNNDLLTAQEVADLLKIKKNTVYELIKRGEIPSSKVGKQVRISQDDVNNYLKQSKGNTTVQPIRNSNDQHSHQHVNNIEATDESKDNSNLILCGQDVILDLIANHISTQINMPNVFRSYMGSYNSLYALYQNKVNVATAHLWDAETDEYNIPYIKKLLPGIPVTVVRLVGRLQGLYVKKGNPKNIVDWKDLTRSDVTMINREKGCGTRILLDEKLMSMGILGRNINGYYRECPSHLVAASTIARDGADVSIGTEKGIQQVSGVDFIPLQKEWYDLILRKEDNSKYAFKAILNYVKSLDFRADLETLGGYDLSQTGVIIK